MQKLCEITSTLLNAKINGSLLLYKIEQAYNMLDLLGRKENKRKEGGKKKKKKKKRGGGRHTKKNTERYKQCAHVSTSRKAGKCAFEEARERERERAHAMYKKKNAAQIPGNVPLRALNQSIFIPLPTHGA